MVTMETLRDEKRERFRFRGSRRACDTSDLDLLVEWEAGRSLLDHVGLAQDLEELLGTRVHVGTEPSLHWYVRSPNRSF
jgi:predicted nucleotidyltransferase